MKELVLVKSDKGDFGISRKENINYTLIRTNVYGEFSNPEIIDEIIINKDEITIKILRDELNNCLEKVITDDVKLHKLKTCAYWLKTNCFKLIND